MSRRKKKISVDTMRSGFEGTLYKQLLHMEKATDIKDIDYESEKLKYVTEHTYMPDFVITLSSGRKIYIEAKGYFRASDRSKLVAVREAHPEKDIRLVFQNNGKLHKLSPTRYADWADKHSFQYAVGSIPKDWFIE